MHCYKSIFAKRAAILAVLISSNAIANTSDSLYSASIQWNDEAGKTALLATTPKWDDAVIKTLFDAYSHPERYQFPASYDDNKYNVQFINAFWGPLNNPFQQYSRPAKAFVFLSRENIVEPDNYYIAPLIKDESDGNYYVFAKDQKQPMLLDDWVNAIKTTHADEMLRFNVCQGYGNLPADTCAGKSYQDEVAFYNTGFVRETGADQQIPSARRAFYEDWQTKVRHRKLQRLTTGKYIIDESVAWNDMAARKKLLATVETWSNYQVIKDNFEKIRDIRYFQDDEKPDFLRRIPWLYPDDGCWTRSAAVLKDLFGPFNNIANHYPRPSKVYAFGNLCANTPNTSDGSVSWWYHTAPIIRDAQTNQTYVLDPAIDPYKPLAVKQWMDAISSRSNACAKSKAKVVKFNVCNGYGITPYDECQNPQTVHFSTEAYAMLHQSAFRIYERERQVELKRDVDEVLGDLPPWHS